MLVYEKAWGYYEGTTSGLRIRVWGLKCRAFVVQAGRVRRDRC